MRHITFVKYEQILSLILLPRLTPYTEEIIGGHQCGFRRNRSTTDHTLRNRQTAEEKREYNESVRQVFIELKNSMIQLQGRLCIILSLSLLSPRNW